jgi:hypothetical protein
MLLYFIKMFNVLRSKQCFNLTPIAESKDHRNIIETKAHDRMGAKGFHFLYDVVQFGVCRRSSRGKQRAIVE